MIAARPPRPLSYVLPVLLLVVGAVLLLANAGVLPEGAGWRLFELWPLLLIMIGLQLVVSRVLLGQAASAVALVAVGLVALGGLVYVAAGPRIGGAYSTFSSGSPLTGVSAGRLTIDGAGSRVTINDRAVGDVLFRTDIQYKGSRPGYEYSNGDLHLSTGRVTGFGGGGGSSVVDLELNPGVPWTVVVNGAGVTLTLDLSAGELRSFVLNGVGSRAHLTLAAPVGEVPVHVAGVGTEVTVSLPAETEYRVTGQGLATSVSGTSQTPGWEAATNRYDISANGIAARVVVEERNP